MAGISVLPLGPSISWGAVSVEDEAGAVSATISCDKRIASIGYLSAMVVPLIEGRFFDQRDAAGGPAVAIVNENFANRFWPDDTAITFKVLL